MQRLLTIVLCTLALAPTLAGAPPRSYDHARLDRILEATVAEERVDYLALGEDWRGELKHYLAELSEIDPDGLTREDRLAFYINLYNATMLAAVIEADPLAFKPSDDDFAIFKKPLVKLDGGRISLDALEHEIIRPKFGEPRIHVALVCGARSCPPLLPRAYRGENLDAVLEANMRRFVNDPSRNRVDRDARTLKLSQLFEWFAEDFGGADALASYVDGYTDGQTRGFAVTFEPYSWELNGR